MTSESDGAGIDLECLASLARALFVHDERGRLVARRDVGSPPPPLFFFARSPAGTLWRLAASLAEDRVRSLARLAAREPPWALAAGEESALQPPPERLEALRQALAALGTAPPTVWRGPVLRFPASFSWIPGADSVEVVDLGSAGLDLSELQARFPGWGRALASRAPVVAALEAGRPVALCGSVRIDPTPGGVAEAGVETLASHRGRGLGRQVVAAWVARVRASGREPLYSTRWENRASRALARALGAAVVAEILHLSPAG